MPIQFFCPTCRQPIEVDDDVANQAVTCPYCQKAVTAPAQSDPLVSMRTPDAAATAAPPPLPVIPEIAGPAPSNKLGWGALICAVACLLTLLFSLVIGLRVAKDLGPNPSRENLNAAIQERMRNSGLQAVSLLGGCVVPIVGIALGVAALVRRRRPMWPAVVAVIAIGLYLLMVCIGLMVQASAVMSRTGAKAS